MKSILRCAVVVCVAALLACAGRVPDQGGDPPDDTSGTGGSGAPGPGGVGGSGGGAAAGRDGGSAAGGAAGRADSDGGGASDARADAPGPVDAAGEGGLIFQPAAPSSKLPVVMIDVKGARIGSSTKTPGRLKIIVDHDGTHQDLATRVPALDSAMGVSLRGSSSLGFGQKSYSVELRDDAGVERKAAVLGMPTGEDWALVGCWTDKPCMRNALAFAVGGNLGRWNPRFRFVEVFLDGKYNGLYIFTEVIRADKSRVPLARPAADATAGDLSGGYIFRREAQGKASPTTVPPRDWVSAEKAPDQWGHQLIYTYHFPRENDITPAQKKYLNDYVASFEAMMKTPEWADPVKGYPAWIDLATWVDYALVSEFTNNVDSYWKSLYMVKQPDPMPGVRGKLMMTPLWDFNIAFGNANYIQGWLLEIWNYKRDSVFPGICADWLPKGPPLCAANCCTPQCAAGAKCWNLPYLPWWWIKIWSSPQFQSALKCRWRELRRGPIAMPFIEANVQQWKEALAPLAIPRHFARWPELRKPVWPNPCEIDTATGALKMGTANKFRLPGLPDPNCGSPTASVPEFFDYEVKWLLAWIKARIDWVDRSLPGTCTP